MPEFHGTDADDVIYGTAGDDIIDGGGGSDWIYGSQGADTLNGGDGTDTLYSDGFGLDLGEEIDTLDGGAGHDFISISYGDNGAGGADSDGLSLSLRNAPSGVTLDLAFVAAGGTIQVGGGTITGFEGYGTIHGSDFADTILIGDMIALSGSIFGDDGDDTITASMHSDDLCGDAGDDRLEGRDGDDVISGGAGSDAIWGGAGSDVIWGGEGDDSIDAGPGTNEIAGGPGNDTIEAGDGDDEIDGGPGSDVMAGGDGYDTYHVDNAGDSVTENEGAGTDRIDTGLAVFSIAPLPHVENLVGTGQVDQDLIGNALANRIDGGPGADAMTGGAGDDVYIADDEGDSAIELPGGGYDHVLSSATFTLGGEIENLILTGSAPIDGIGSDYDENIAGNAGSNILLGGGGDDRLEGRDGDDGLYGGPGSDYLDGDEGFDIFFYFDWSDSAGASVDSIGYFRTGVDTIDLTFAFAGSVSWVDTRSGIVVTVETVYGPMTINVSGSVSQSDFVLTPGLIFGTAGNDILQGTPDIDFLFGGAGADAMTGGPGDDYYFVDNGGDTVSEAPDAGIDIVESSIGFTLPAEIEHLFLTGTAAIDAAGNALDNLIIGNSGANSIDGGAGDDVLDGDGGADTMRGGAGNDLFLVDAAGDRAVETAAADGHDGIESSVSFALGDFVEDLTLAGTAAIDGTGNGLANRISGNSGANRLDGRPGADAMAGGLGNDLYVVDQTGDTVTEAANAGTDTVQSPVSFTLGANVENLILTGAGAVNGTGNALANLLTGNSNSNRLDGGAGTDSMAGGLGHDTYVVDHAGDTATEAAGAGVDMVQSSVSFALGSDVENLTLTGTGAVNGTGNALANALTGNSNSNRLDGAAGADSMAGGLGHDTYVVDHVLDKAVESAGAGTDSVLSSVTFTLGANVETLTLTGTGVINGTGNALANTLTGNSNSNRLDGAGGADSMAGGLGHDVYVVDNAGDKVTEAANAGSDMVLSSVTFTLGANVENLILTGTGAVNGIGNALTNSLAGNSNSNRLDGGAGADSMAGGLGHDTYVVDNIGDKVSEGANAGSDSVQSPVSFTLGANVENLVLTGAAAVNGTGNALANAVTGNSAANVLRGGAGNDMLRGAAGADSFQFDTAPGSANIDHIADFAHGTDRILLENAVFAGLGAGALPASAFATGTTATNASHRILYDAATGALRFDSDGSGGGAAILFAILDTHPASLAASDFAVI